MQLKTELEQLQCDLWDAEQNYKLVTANNHKVLTIAVKQVVDIQSKIMMLDPRVK